MNRKLTGSIVAVALALLALQSPVQAQTRGRLTITVEGLLPAGGILRLGLYDRKGYGADSDPVKFADVPVRLPVTVVTFADIPPGEYAVMTYQDVNSNDKTDSNFLGIPTEPYGFSRNAKPFLSKPGFDDARFTVSAGENSQTLRLQNTGK
jgi:uncharacterized protein (DUF2141 family)